MVQEYTNAFGPTRFFRWSRRPSERSPVTSEAEAAVFEAARLLSSKGAQIICHPSLEEEGTPWLAVKQAIGYQCQVFLLTGVTSRNIGANEPNGDWAGGCCDDHLPGSQVMAQLAGHDEGGIAQTIDLNTIEAAKEKERRQDDAGMDALPETLRRSRGLSGASYKAPWQRNLESQLHLFGNPVMSLWPKKYRDKLLPPGIMQRS